MNLNCFAIVWIKNNDDFSREYLDLNFTNTNNIIGIKHYLEDVLKIRDYIIEWTFLDFDHFVMLYEK